MSHLAPETPLLTSDSLAVGAKSPPLLIAGPDSLESEELALTIATELVRLQDKLQVPFVFKGSYDKANRSSHLSYRGPGIEAGLNILARVQQEISGVRVVLWQMVLSLPIFAFAGIAFETIQWENLAFGPVAGLLYQGVVIAGLGFMVISYLLGRYPPSLIASFNFVSPISGVLLSAMLLGEAITPAIVGGVACVGAGLYFVSRPKTA